MRKLIFVFTMLLPLGFLAANAMLFLLWVESDLSFIVTPYLYGLFALSISILYGIFQENRNLFVKLAGLPVDIGIAIYFISYCQKFAIATGEGAMGGGLGIAILIVELLPYVFSRIATGISCAVVCSRTIQKRRLLHSLLHLIPLADLVSAAMVHKQLHT